MKEHRAIFIACVWHVETVNDQLKTISQIEHSRHRSVRLSEDVSEVLICYPFRMCDRPINPQAKRVTS